MRRLLATFGGVLAIVCHAAPAFAGAAPEIDLGSSGSALAVIACVAIMLLERRLK